MVDQRVRRRGGRGLYGRDPAVQPEPGANRVKRSPRHLPEYLDKPDVDALVAAASSGPAKLLILLQWRAGLRVSEAVNVLVQDLDLEAERPTLRVREGKGGKDRLVPVHPELAGALRTVLAFRIRPRGEHRLVDASRSTAWRWVKAAQLAAERAGTLLPGKQVGTHTLRHSFARHALASGVPINVVQRWLGHASLSTTLIYLEILPDPLGHIERLP